MGDYFSITELYKYRTAFNFVIGGRGTGKTYGALMDCVLNKRKIMFMRRSQTQLQQVFDVKTVETENGVKKVSLSPFKPVERDLGIEVQIEKINKDLYAFFLDGFHLGYGCALNTLNNLRGFDASDIDYLIFDEFIPLPGEMVKKDEARIFLDAYESINRNREFTGKPPLFAYLLANANDIDCPILLDMGLTEVIEKMINKGRRFICNKSEEYTVSLLENKSFEEKKRNTAIYRFTKKMRYNAMAFENKFAYDDFSDIASKDIREYTVQYSVGEYYFYRHKSRDEIYISKCRMTTKENYPETEYGLQQCRVAHGRELYGAYMENRIKFETYRAKKLLTDLVA